MAAFYFKILKIVSVVGRSSDGFINDRELKMRSSQKWPLSGIEASYHKSEPISFFLKSWFFLENFMTAS